MQVRKVKAIQVGSACIYGTLISATLALLTAVLMAVLLIVVERRVIEMLVPVIKVFGGSVEEMIANVTTNTLYLLLFYALGTTLFGAVFTTLAVLIYNLLARWTGGFTIEVEESRETAGSTTSDKQVSV